jgi:transcriptional regulator with XRE-family HTH domain
MRLVAVAGWSQAETARRLNITAGAVSQILSGKTRPRQALLNLLTLLVASAENNVKPRVHRPATSRPTWEKELMQCMHKLSDSHRQLVMRLARELAGGNS